MQSNNQVQKPFFASFLENQANAKVTSSQQEAAAAEQAENQVTLKFPSDWDDDDFNR